MNDGIRAEVRRVMAEKGVTQAELSKLTGKHPNAISRALNGLPDGGKIPPLWEAILSALGLTLAAVPVQSQAGVTPSSSAEPEGQDAEGETAPAPAPRSRK